MPFKIYIYSFHQSKKQCSSYYCHTCMKCHFGFGTFPKSENTKFARSCRAILLWFCLSYTCMQTKLLPENFWFCVLTTALLLSSAEKQSSLSNVYLDCHFNLHNPTTLILHILLVSKTFTCLLTQGLSQQLTYSNWSLCILGDTSTVWEAPCEVIYSLKYLNNTPVQNSWQ